MSDDPGEQPEPPPVVPDEPTASSLTRGRLAGITAGGVVAVVALVLGIHALTGGSDNPTAPQGAALRQPPARIFTPPPAPPTVVPTPTPTATPPSATFALDAGQQALDYCHARVRDQLPGAPVAFPSGEVVRPVTPADWQALGDYVIVDYLGVHERGHWTCRTTATVGSAPQGTATVTRPQTSTVNAFPPYAPQPQVYSVQPYRPPADGG